jgi:hypothetical protein
MSTDVADISERTRQNSKGDKTPYTKTQSGKNQPESFAHIADREGVCLICTKRGNTRRTLTVIVTPFAWSWNTAPDKELARTRLQEMVRQYINGAFYHPECMQDFMDALGESGILERILPELVAFMEQKRTQFAQRTRDLAVGNGA